MKCSLCGLQISKNTCEFCGNVTIVEPLVSEYDIELYGKINNLVQDKIANAKRPADFRIQGDILVNYTGKSDIVIIPDNIRIIAEHCFKNTNIKKIKFPSTVEYIGNEPKDEYDNNNGAFEFCEELESIFFDNNSRLKSIEKYAFYGCKKMKAIIGLPMAIKDIKSHAFCQCDLNETSINAIINNTDKKGLSDDWNK